MANFAEIDESRKILGLGETATLKDIKKAYRKLSLKYHPDRCEDKKECEKTFKKINHANEILMAYCAGYRYCFDKEEVKKTSMDEEFREHLKRFYDGWWGDLEI